MRFTLGRTRLFMRKKCGGEGRSDRERREYQNLGHGGDLDWELRGREKGFWDRQ
jgi:hypothetical protein